MAEEESLRFDLRALLDAVETAPPVNAVPVLAEELARIVGAADVSFLIADLSGDALVRFLTPSWGVRDIGEDDLVTVPLAGSPYEQVIRSQKPSVEPEGDWTRLYAPVTERGEVLGVLELALPSPPNEDVVAFVAAAAHALAYVVIVNRRHTDLFERGTRDVPFSLAAEIQRRLLPASSTLEGSAFTLAGQLEPASDIAGDTFDYSLDRGVLHLSISDAMGHAVGAAQLATVAVGSLRNSRRSRVSVVDQARAANEAIADHADDEEFVSALLLRADLASGRVAAVNAGHPNPYLVRDGVVAAVDLDADLPLGAFTDAEFSEQSIQLQPGDRLVLVTDGMLERNAASLDIAGALVESIDLHARDMVHGLARAVVGEAGGELEDDATVFCLDWHGQESPDDQRAASAGASQGRASGRR